MSGLVNVSDEALSSALTRLHKDGNAASSEAGRLKGEMGSLSSHLSSLQGMCNQKAALTRQRISQAEGVIGQLNAEIARQEAILASCRPGYWETVTTYDSEVIGIVDYALKVAFVVSGLKFCGKLIFFHNDAKIMLFQILLSTFARKSIIKPMLL